MQLNVTLFELNERNGMRETATSSINMKRVADFKMINSVKCENSKFWILEYKIKRTPSFKIINCNLVKVCFNLNVIVFYIIIHHKIKTT